MTTFTVACLDWLHSLGYEIRHGEKVKSVKLAQVRKSTDCA